MVQLAKTPHYDPPQHALDNHQYLDKAYRAGLINPAEVDLIVPDYKMWYRQHGVMDPHVDRSTDINLLQPADHNVGEQQLHQGYFPSDVRMPEHRGAQRKVLSAHRIESQQPGLARLTTETMRRGRPMTSGLPEDEAQDRLPQGTTTMDLVQMARQHTAAMQNQLPW